MSLLSLVSQNDEFLLVKKNMVKKLLACGDGDGALLYLYLLLKGKNFREEEAQKDLGFDKLHFEKAAFTLTGLDLMINSEDQPEKKEKSPSYSPQELSDARMGDHRFAAVCQAAESALGRTLTGAQLKTLFTAYDHLGIPADVLMLLLTDLKTRGGQVTRKAIAEETYLWADLGLNSLSKATDYLERRDNEAPHIRELMTVLGIYDREPTANEKRYLSEIVRQGFNKEAFQMAKDRTESAIGKFSWRYLKAITDRWHKANVHTQEEILAFEPATKFSKKNTLAEKNYIHQPTPKGELADWEKDWLREIGRSKQEE